MKQIFFFIAWVICLPLVSQTDSLDASNDPRVKDALQLFAPKSGAHVAAASVPIAADPEFPGGQAALTDFIQQNVRYPKEAEKEGITGKVYVKFTIDEKGVVRDALVLKKVGYGFDEEALRVVGLMPKWLPAINNNKYCTSSRVIPITFK